MLNVNNSTNQIETQIPNNNKYKEINKWGCMSKTLFSFLYYYKERQIVFLGITEKLINRLIDFLKGRKFIIKTKQYNCLL